MPPCSETGGATASGGLGRATGGPVVVVAGPTASGKSALALRIAEELDGTVINADSMQIYAGIAVLTAQPGTEDLARAPHRLYGVRDPVHACSVAEWRELALNEIAACHAEGRLPVLTGGTGLYLHALRYGLSPIPEIPEATRAAARALHAEIGGAALHDRLRERDPQTAARIRASDPQRLIRAWEVLEATGRPLVEWQAEAPKGAVDLRFAEVLLLPPRDLLYPACDTRFLKMLDAGALEEVAKLFSRQLDPALPAMKAVGVPELSALLDGKMSREEAVTRAQQSTRRYAKRQYTWFRHRMPEALRSDAQFSERMLPQILHKIRCRLLTEKD